MFVHQSLPHEFCAPIAATAMRRCRVSSRFFGDILTFFNMSDNFFNSLKVYVLKVSGYLPKFKSSNPPLKKSQNESDVFKEAPLL